MWLRGTETVPHYHSTGTGGPAARTHGTADRPRGTARSRRPAARERAAKLHMHAYSTV
jgi:hypothetical protein